MSDSGNLFRLMSRSGLSLFLFAVLGVGVVTFFYVLTAERIEKNEREYMMRNLNELIPASAYDNDFFTDTIDVIDEELLGSDQGVAVYRARRQGQRVVLVRCRGGAAVVVDHRDLVSVGDNLDCRL